MLCIEKYCDKIHHLKFKNIYHTSVKTQQAKDKNKNDDKQFTGMITSTFDKQKGDKVS